MSLITGFIWKTRVSDIMPLPARKDIISHVSPEHRKLIHRALIIREKIIGMYKERGITGERLALVAAITLGQKNMLDADQKSYFIKAGVMHIMAVSGLHTVILSLFVFNVLFFLKRTIQHHQNTSYNNNPVGICICYRTYTICIKGNTDVLISAGRKPYEKTSKRNKLCTGISICPYYYQTFSDL